MSANANFVVLHKRPHPDFGPRRRLLRVGSSARMPFQDEGKRGRPKLYAVAVVPSIFTRGESARCRTLGNRARQLHRFDLRKVHRRFLSRVVNSSSITSRPPVRGTTGGSRTDHSLIQLAISEKPFRLTIEPRCMARILSGKGVRRFELEESLHRRRIGWFVRPFEAFHHFLNFSLRDRWMSRTYRAVDDGI